MRSREHRAAASQTLAAICEFGDAQPRTLAGAFVKPVQGEDLAAASVAQLTDWRAKLDHAYGPAAEATAIMDVSAGQGTLAEIVAFCRDAAGHA